MWSVNVIYVYMICITPVLCVTVGHFLFAQYLVEKQMAVYVISRRLLGGGSTTSQLAGALRYGACWRSYSTSFREEKDTFGPILVPSDK